MKYEEPTLYLLFVEDTVDTVLTSGENGDISVWPPVNPVATDDCW